MELSFTQGRWNYENWGGFDPVSSSNAKPPGVELWGVFDVPLEQVDASWRNLTHTLSGLFCASINFLESSTMYSAPEWSFRPASGILRYGVLPREAVCTENLTPWLKLLPCRDKAGLSALLDRPSIYRSFYHSQQLRLTSTKFASDDKSSGIVLKQTLTVVLKPNIHKNKFYETKLQPSWSLSSIFGRKVTGSCVLSKSSNLYLQLDRGLVPNLKKNKVVGDNREALDGLWSNLGFELSVEPDTILEEDDWSYGKGSSTFHVFSIDKYSDSQPFDLGLTWKTPAVWSSQRAPLHASRFLMGSGNERGSIAILLKSAEKSDKLSINDSNNDQCKIRVDVFQVVPWYVKVYYHTLQLFLDEQPRAVEDFIDKIHVLPSKDKKSPGVLELALKFPCSVKAAVLTVEFDKGFLHIDEYPPDANQGFDIPSAVISFPDFHTMIPVTDSDHKSKSPMFSNFQKKSPVLCYTEVLLVPLTTPDFSMPYNVITITCTVFALYFGSSLNVLRRRVGEEERLLKSKAARKHPLAQILPGLYAKLRGRPWEPTKSSVEPSSSTNRKLILKLVLLAIMAVLWQYYISRV